MLKTRVRQSESSTNFEEMMITIRDGLSDVARSMDEEDGDDEHGEDPELGKLSEDDEPG